ncbi:MAG TPA: nuclear transport factor 2 family protein [Baekduia sp.]|nr:nuclear transport factor 2 family protein [Baekduia sp.]
MTPAERVTAYYDDLRTGDADRIARHFTEDAVHWFTRREPEHGARTIARDAALAVEQLGAVWTLEHLVANDDEAAIEWSMAYDHPRSGRRVMDRGAELFAFRDGRISEVRAYYAERGGDLVGFDHAARGHSTL